MVVDATPPPSRWTPHVAQAHAARASTERAPTEQTRSADRPDPAAAAPPRPRTDTVEVSGGGQTPASPWLEQASQQARAGRGSASGALGLDVVV